MSEKLFNDPRAETERTNDIKAQIGVIHVREFGDQHLEDDCKELPDIAATAITQLVTKKGHLLGVGKEKHWALLGMNRDDLERISNLRKRFPGRITGNFCYGYYHTIRGHCGLCNAEYYTELATRLACEDTGSGTLQHAGNHTEKAGLSTLTGIIQNAYETMLKTNSVKELNELLDSSGVIKYLSAPKANEWWGQLPDKEK